jgi:DNA-binding winged helix-turn-helix (wHTH) protein
MNKKIIQNLLVGVVLICTGLVTVAAFLGENKKSDSHQEYSERINLALRRTAHLLLKQAGDSTSTIAPVKKSGDNSYLVKMEHYFNYDSLPVLLKNSLALHGITEGYDVEVWDCKNVELVLGYNSIDFSNGTGVTCGGRNQAVSCFNFKVIFRDMSVVASQKPIVYVLLGALSAIIMGGAFYYFYIFLRKKGDKPIEKDLQQIDEKYLVRFGKSVFDTHNQVVFIENTPQKLTFREAKLLNLFCEHKNELLDRDFILKSVWEDEGVLVGRSVDVFVSRLRKILKEDDTLKITNVHGRGYRFEVGEVLS